MMKKNPLMTDRQLADFCNQLAMILNSGMSLTEGLEMMKDDAAGQEEQTLLESLQQIQEQTGSFSQALEEAKYFPGYMVQMVRLGEETGHLDDVMLALTDHYDREDSLRKSIRSAVAYPVMMLLMMLLIVVVLLTRVMPIFNQVFLQLGTELTGFSRSLLHLGLGIKRYAVVLAVLAAVLLLCGILVRYSPKASATFGCALGKMPFMRKFRDKIALCRFSSGMALALSSGINPEYALELVQGLSRDGTYQTRLQNCREQVEAGEDFSHVLLKAGIFTGVYARMAAIGQKTGTMDQIMRRIADDCQEELDQKIAGLLSAIEPTLVIILSVIVGVILMSVMFPLLGIMSGI